MSDQNPAGGAPPQQARPPRSPGSLIRNGALAATIGTVLLLLSVVILNYFHRWDDRVAVTGTVTDVYSDLNKVDYRLGADKHVGVLLGDYQVGESVRIDVPSDGSVYRILYLSDSTTTKVFSHLTMYTGLPLALLGGYLLTLGVVRRNRAIAAEVAARYAPLLASFAPPPPPPSTASSQEYRGTPDGSAQPAQPPPPKPPTPEARTPDGYFQAPYDL